MKLNKYIIAAGAPILFLCACDNIDENDRYIPVPKPEGERVLLIQEFTGHACTNCPQGAAAIHSIESGYPGRVISVGLHPAGGGPNTAPLPNGQNFRCAEAQVMYDFYHPSAFPCAVFNGIMVETTDQSSTDYSSWYSIATSMFNLYTYPRVSIDAQTSYDEATRNVTVDYTVEYLDYITEGLSVMVWVMENDIVGMQLDNGTWLMNYVHNHVLRASINGDWGQTIPSGVDVGETYQGSASMVLDNAWKAENCQIVAYVFQTDSKLVEQATLADVIGNGSLDE